jgi:hypothetical protein
MEQHFLNGDRCLDEPLISSPLAFSNLVMDIETQPSYMLSPAWNSHDLAFMLNGSSTDAPVVPESSSAPYDASDSSLFNDVTSWGLPSQFNDLPEYLHAMPQPNELHTAQYFTSDGPYNIPQNGSNHDTLDGVLNQLDNTSHEMSKISPNDPYKISGPMLDGFCNIPNHRPAETADDVLRAVKELKERVEQIARGLHMLSIDLLDSGLVAKG